MNKKKKSVGFKLKNRQVVDINFVSGFRAIMAGRYPVDFLDNLDKMHFTIDNIIKKYQTELKTIANNHCKFNKDHKPLKDTNGNLIFLNEVHANSYAEEVELLLNKENEINNRKLSIKMLCQRVELTMSEKKALEVILQ